MQIRGYSDAEPAFGDGRNLANGPGVNLRRFRGQRFSRRTRVPTACRFAIAPVSEGNQHDAQQGGQRQHDQGADIVFV